MIEIQKAIFARLNGDATLATLLGGSGNVRYAFQNAVAEQRVLIFKSIGSIPGQIDTDGAKSRDSLWQFDMYGENTAEIADRVRILLDGHRFASNSQTGGWSMHFSIELPDDFDDDLKVIMKTVRYRAHTVPVGVAEV